ncbi:MAG: enoyl-CoA hydratase/isomerase family protein [Bacteriovoracaceae bacterium]|nr:enoyl-CoA hydratase/isomerase family protein [Bacteriovoracaceae bacterium]
MSFYQETFNDLLVRKGENREKHLLWITLNRPDFSNAFSDGMIEDLCKVLKHADWDNDIRVIIVTGIGKCFCAGGDLSAMEQKSGMFAGHPNELRIRYMKGIQQIPITMESLQTPVIAMVGGPAIGAGCDLACMCDIRIGCEKTKFGETFSKLALIPGDGGTFFLQRIVGYSKAMELSLTGEVINAEEALKIGLLNHLVHAEKLLDKTKSLALKIAGNAPVAISMTKKAIKSARTNNIHSHLDLLAAYQGITQRTDDHVEGLKALREKRTPEFNGQ